MELKKIDLDPKPATPTPTPAPVAVEKPTPSFKEPMSPKLFSPIKIVGLILVLLLGVGSGYLLRGGGKAPERSGGPIVARNVPESGLKEGDIIGEQNAKEFKDSATGVLQKGGLDGEGSHQLLRPGGASQTVYLTSSIIDLDEFVGHQVTVWGETFKGQKAGWLMDVGRVKVEKLNAPNPE
jgi:hypothetical protein